MRALKYHSGQIAVQEEANSRDLADYMADWVGPAAEFASMADMLLFASRGNNGRLEFAAISGPAPLVEVDGESSLLVKGPTEALPEGMVGGLAINLAERRRVRLNGNLSRSGSGARLDIDEAFTLCRKYLAPSTGLSDQRFAGPSERREIQVDDPWLADLVSRAETTFLASVSPDGMPDVAHRGGPAGFLELDPPKRSISWPEYLGDGVFKSAGNVRATATSTLLVLDLESGDGAEVMGSGSYENLRIMRGPRREPLVRDKFDFPTQGRMRVSVEKVMRLTGVTALRRPVSGTSKITSRSRIDDQAPQ